MCSICAGFRLPWRSASLAILALFFLLAIFYPAQAAKVEATQTETSESNLINALFASIFASPNATKVGYLLALR